ncbi:MAG: response regulator [Rhodocyclales bacterium]|nr:response regulator [Rhodocyclales bacterium]
MKKTCVLVVEDEPVESARLVENLEAEGYDVIVANTGLAAWRIIDACADRFDLILLDRKLPDSDGLDILRRLKAAPATQNTPVVMQTAMTDNTSVAEGLRAGAFYYLTKPFSADTLLAIIGAALADRNHYLEMRQEAQMVGRSLSCMRESRFSFRTMDEARSVAALLANVCPDPGKAVLGLSELMFNAVEHGLAQIGYQRKTLLLEAGTLQDEIMLRIGAPERAHLSCEVSMMRGVGGISFMIRDPGPGFDWRSYLEISPERAFDTHGRGIAMARLSSLDRLEYLGRGNEALAFIYA